MKGTALRRPDQPRHGHRGRPEWQERKRAPNAVYSDRIGRIERLVIMYSVLEIWCALFSGPIVAALMARPIGLPKCGEELLHEFVLPDLRNDYMNQFQAGRWF